MTKQGPNLLFIQSDQHSAAVLGCAGDPLVQTPNLDRLAASGVMMDSAYCASPICVPSRSSLLTGRHPFENQVWTNSHILDSAIPTMAHAMGAAGYRPVQIGRMHFNGPDQLHGYVERLVGDHGPNHPGGRAADHGQLHGTAGPHRVSLQLSGRGQSAYQVHDEYVTAATVDYLDRFAIRARSGQSESAFCISVGLMLPHQPFVARREDFDLYAGSMTMPRNPAPSLDRVHPYLRWWREHAGITDVPEEEILRARTAYWALVTRLDRMMGEILEALDRSGLTENTLIVYTTDHGEQVGERGLWWKQTFYDDSARVPVLLSWPGRIPAGSRCERVVTHMDLNATLLDALGAPALPGSRGRSFLPLITGSQGASWDDVALSEYCTEPGDPSHAEGEWTTQQRMIRRDEWKLIYYRGMPAQLFNLREDPEEAVDRSGDPGCQQVVRELEAAVLAEWDPGWVDARVRALTRTGEVLKAWAQNVQPEDKFRWDLKPEMDYLEGQ